MKREFLQLAQTYKSSKHGVGGWWWSEKLDGYRCFWDGGISRGIPKIEVPWANNDKDSRYVNPPIATGLWTRYGNVYHAPNWWLDTLPRLVPLDGELWNGIRKDGNRQTIGNIIKPLTPTDRWHDIDLMVFGQPSYKTVFADGKIDNINYKKKFEDIIYWVANQICMPVQDLLNHNPSSFRKVYNWLQSFHDTQTKEDGTLPFLQWKVLPQYQLAYQTSIAETQIQNYLLSIEAEGGEGLIIINQDKPWIPERHHNCLKVKKRDDAEATVTGYITGREGKLLGLMGALIVDYKGKQFELSGFTDEERKLNDKNYSGEWLSGEHAFEWAVNNPETECPNDLINRKFPRGSIITFKYRGLSKDGIPQEASYWRKDDRF